MGRLTYTSEMKDFAGAEADSGTIGNGGRAI